MRPVIPESRHLRARAACCSPFPEYRSASREWERGAVTLIPPRVLLGNELGVGSDE